METFGDSPIVGPMLHVGFVELALDKQHIRHIAEVTTPLGCSRLR